jgi:hypothetical protein
VAELTPEKEREYKFRMRLEAEQEAESRRRTPQEMSKEYTGSILPFRIDEEGKRHLAVPGFVQSAIEAIKAPSRALQSGQGDYMEGKSPGEEEAFNVALNAIGPSLAGKGALPSLTARATERLAGAASRGAVKDATWASAREAGFVLPPNVIEPTMLGHGAEALAGKTYLKRGAQIKNQEVVDKLARKAAGLGENDPLDIPHFKAAREEMAAPYKEIAEVSPTAKQALKQVQKSRERARELHKDANRTGRSEKRDEAREWDKKADKWEGVIDQEAIKVGRPGLLKELQDARVKIAKSHDVQEATNMGSGEVDAKYIGRKFDAAPERMTGELATIGRFANAFGDYVKEGVVDAGSDIHIGAHVSRHGMPGLFGWLGSGIPLARGPIRRIALSDIAQQTKDYKPGMSVKLSDIASKGGKYSFPAVTGLGLGGDEE